MDDCPNAHISKPSEAYPSLFTASPKPATTITKPTTTTTTTNETTTTPTNNKQPKAAKPSVSHSIQKDSVVQSKIAIQDESNTKIETNVSGTGQSKKKKPAHPTNSSLCSNFQFISSPMTKRFVK